MASSTFYKLIINKIKVLIYYELNFPYSSIKMSKKEMTLVYYHVPEDKDDPDCPNVYGVPYNKTTLKLSHIH